MRTSSPSTHDPAPTRHTHSGYLSRAPCARCPSALSGRIVSSYRVRHRLCRREVYFLQIHVGCVEVLRDAYKLAVLHSHKDVVPPLRHADGAPPRGVKGCDVLELRIVHAIFLVF